MVANVHEIFLKFKTNLSEFGKNVKGANYVMKQNQQQLKAQAKGFHDWGNKGAKAAGKFRLLMHGLRGFRMEMLGVMFFGMAMQRFFNGLLKPALQITGVFELWTSILQILFLPVALMVLDWVIKLMDWISGLSEKTKKMIGIFALAGAGIGAFLFIFGQFFLGIGSIIVALGSLGIGLIGLLGPLGLIAAGIFTMAGGFGKLWDIIKIGAGGVLSMLDTLWENFLDIPMVTAFFEKIGVDVEKLKDPLESFKKFISGIWGKIKEKYEIAVLIMRTTWNRVLFKMKNKFIETWNEMKNKLNTWIKDNFDTSIEDMVAGIQKVIDKVQELLSLFNKNNFLKNFFKGADIVGREGYFSALWDALQSKSQQMVLGEPNYSFSPTVNVNASSNVDIEQLKTQLSSQWNEDFVRLSR